MTRLSLGCSFIMLSLGPNEHLGHISGSAVNFYFVSATAEKFCTGKVLIKRCCIFLSCIFSFFDFINSELYNLDI